MVLPSEEEDCDESSEPKSRHPGANKISINENTSIFNFIEGLRMPLPIGSRRNSIDKRDAD